jgi:hypothetical protein
MKYLVVTGGVVSGLGKGISISSIGVLLKASGLSITAVKIDPYLNSDAGTMSPFEHGEVFVLNDGGEVRAGAQRCGAGRQPPQSRRLTAPTPHRAPPPLPWPPLPTLSPPALLPRPTSTWATTSASSTSRSRATTTSRRARCTRR